MAVNQSGITGHYRPDFLLESRHRDLTDVAERPERREAPRGRDRQRRQGDADRAVIVENHFRVIGEWEIGHHPP